MSEWEDKLPPIIREKLDKIGEITQEDINRTKEMEKLNILLLKFYKGDLNADGLWKQMKRYEDKDYLLVEAQRILLNSIILQNSDIELEKRKEGIIAMDTLRGTPRTAEIDQVFNSIKALQTRKKEEYEEARERIKVKVENNPQLRTQQIQQGQNTVVIQLPIDQAIQVNPEWKSFVTDHQKGYRDEFDKLHEQLEEIVSKSN